MDRKVQAIEERMGANLHPDNLDTVYCGAGDDDDDDLILATYDARTDKFTPTLGFEDVDALIVASRTADIVVVDPLANTFEGPEGNELLKRMARLLRRLARRHDVAVILILHTKKYADGMAGNMDAGPQRRNPRRAHPRRSHPVPDDRGRGRRHGIAPRDAATASSGSTTASRATAPGTKTRWFEISETVTATSTTSASSASASSTRGSPHPLFHGISNQTIHAILRDIDQGVHRERRPADRRALPARRERHALGRRGHHPAYVQDCSSRPRQADPRRLETRAAADRHHLRRHHPPQPARGPKIRPGEWPGTAN